MRLQVGAESVKASRRNTAISADCRIGLFNSRGNVNNNWLAITALALNVLVALPSQAQSGDATPTLCNSKEFTVLSAKMLRDGNVDEGTAVEKILSLCADQDKEPFRKFVYRYGAVGNIELEQIASAESKFGLSRQSDGDAHSRLLAISFSKHKYAYEVGEGVGMTSGVRL